jgi:hypothetical protein
MPIVVMASVILHIVCEQRGEDFPIQENVNGNDKVTYAYKNYNQRRDEQYPVS